jgi:hypothetical protein
MMATAETRTCGLCGLVMDEKQVDAPLPLLPVVYWCRVCDVAPLKKASK